MRISGLAAVVTGGASGLGGAVARMLALQEAKVTIFDRNPALAEAKAREIGARFVQESLGRQVPFPSRLGQPDEFAVLVQSIRMAPK